MPATPTRDRVIPEADVRPLRRPEWIKVRAPSGETYEWLHGLMRKKELHTVCEEAMCPNLGECWGSGTATFLMLGDVCTRTCAFCDIKHGKPGLLDWGEAERVAQAVKAMELKHAVITSVNRDERRDGGAPIFAMVIRRIRELLPGCSIEVLIPDFKGSLEALKIVMDARPEILNHNVETVPRLFKTVQPQDNYEWAAATLSNAKKLDPEVLTKSGMQTSQPYYAFQFATRGQPQPGQPQFVLVHPHDGALRPDWPIVILIPAEQRALLVCSQPAASPAAKRPGTVDIRFSSTQYPLPVCPPTM